MKRRAFFKIAGLTGAASLLDVARLRVACAGSRSDYTSQRTFQPFDLAFDPFGHLYVTDPSRYRILRLDQNNQPYSWFGLPGADEGKLNYPLGVSIDQDGLIYVVDSNNCRIQVFHQDGILRRIIGSVGSIGGSFATPQGIDVYGIGSFLVADTRNHRVQVFEEFELKAVLGDLGDDKDQFRLPTAALIGPDQEIFVLDSKHGMIKVFGKDFKLKQSFGGIGSSPGKLNRPQGMAIDSDGRIWVADTGNHRIQQFDQDGKPLLILGMIGSGMKRFNSPTGITCKNRKVYVADKGNQCVQVLSPANF